MSAADFEKNCRNCKYFEKHYVETPKGFKEALCGYCKNTQLSLYKRRRTIIDIYNTCNFWESAETQKAEMRGAILETLKQMQKSLKELVYILKDD